MPGPKTQDGAGPGWLRDALRIAAHLYVFTVLVAIGVQDHGPGVPRGLFNEGREAYQLASNLCLAFFFGVAGLFAFEFWRGPELGIGRFLRGLIVSYLLLEALLFVVDTTLMSGSATSRIGGPYHQLFTRAGAPVFVRKSHPASDLGFRTARSYAPVPERPRLLFLGDSYTEGSGREPACNYPDVVERSLSARLGRGVEVMNAGVGGYGPVDALHLLELLVERGFEFDAVVYSLFLENDFTDDLPGTERRVMAGVNFRFPDSRFARWFHPLNSRTFRFPLFVVRVGGVVRDETASVMRDTGSCQIAGEPLTSVAPDLRALVERRLDANYHREASYAAPDLVFEAVRGMQRIAWERGAAFALVVFPDRILVDPVLREQIGLAERGPGYDLERFHAWTLSAFADLPLIDVRPLLEGQTGLYRARDTHLNDLGNVQSGELVAERLAGMVATGDVALP